MNEDELRQLVRDVIAGRAAAGTDGPEYASPVAARRHPSHGLFAHLIPPDDRCLIEPSVACNHCGYCKSYGH